MEKKKKKICPTNSNQKRARVVILGSEKDFKTKIVTRDKEGHFE